MKKLMSLVFVLAFAQLAAAQNADAYRGGWRTDDSDPHTYEFSIRGEQVRGIYCTLCSDANTLAFIDGKLSSDGMTFVVTHVREDGSTAYQDRAAARIVGDNLIVTGTSGAPRGGKFQRTAYRDKRGPDPLSVPVLWLPGAKGEIATLQAAARGGGPGPGPGPGAPAPAGGGGFGRQAWQQPGPWKSPLRSEDVAGAWIGFGTGMNKQYFIFRRVGARLRGMVCGRCDNPYTMAALDDIEIQGDVLRFKILHDGWGDARVLPFDKHVTARIVSNEMRATFETPSEVGGRGVRGLAPGAGGGTTLIGPVAIEATKGNDTRPNR